MKRFYLVYTPMLYEQNEEPNKVLNPRLSERFTFIHLYSISLTNSLKHKTFLSLEKIIEK